MANKRPAGELTGSRGVYIGGFMNGPPTVDAVGEALGRYYNGVEAFTFSWARKHPREIALVLRGADVVTHSAGALPVTRVEDLSEKKAPNSVRFVAPPVPVGKGKLIYRAVGPKMAQTLEGDFWTGANYNAHCMVELARHPSQFGSLPDISGFNGFDEAAGLANTVGVHTTVYTMQSDAFFHDLDTIAALVKAGGSVVGAAGTERLTLSTP